MSEVVSSSDFQSKVLDAQGPVLVDFFATWCGPCKMLAPTLDEVAAETAGKAAVYKLAEVRRHERAHSHGVRKRPGEEPGRGRAAQAEHPLDDRLASSSA